MTLQKRRETASMRWLAVCLLTSILGCSQESTSNLPPKQAQAVAALEALGVDVKIKNDEVTFIDFYPASDIAAAIVHLEPFVGLKKVNFAGTKITDDQLACLEPLINLEELALKGSEVTAAGLKHVAGLSKLLVLNLDDCEIPDEGLVHLAGLANLKRLHLNKTKISDTGLVHLAELKNLEHLLLYGTQVTPSGTDQLRQSLPDLKIVAPKNAAEPAVE